MELVLDRLGHVPVRLNNIFLHVATGTVVTAEGAIWVASVPEPRNLKRLRLLGKMRPDARHVRTLATGSSIMLRQARKNYYHWLIDCLPRLYAYQEALNRFPVYLPAPKGVFEESLGYLTPEKAHVRYTAEKWLYVRDYLYLPPWSRDGDGSVPPGYREFVIAQMNLRKAAHSHPGYFFVSRVRANRRRLVEEDRFVRDFLNPLGIRRISFEALSFRMQMQSMHQAKCLVGLHGAGLSNMLVMKRGGQVIEIQSFDRPMAHYRRLAHALDLKYHVVATRFRGAVNDDVILDAHDLAYLRHLLIQWMTDKSL